jgi:hypothetical protein
MAIRHQSTILCDYLIRADNGRFTAAGMFQNINASRMPCAKDPMGVLVQFRGDPQDDYEVVLLRADGEETLLNSGVIEAAPEDLREGQQWAVNLAIVAAAVFDRPGVYSIALRSSGEEVHRFDFGVLAPLEREAEEESV